MFALHETTQRRVCRVIFLVGCLVPTLLTLVWIVYWYRPWRQADWQHALAQQLHVRATLDEVATPRPGVLAMTNLRLADLRTGKPLGAFSKLDVKRLNSRRNFHADHLELPAEQLPIFVNAIATWLATDEIEPLDFLIDRLTITNAELQAVQLANLRISSDLTDPAIQRFRLVSDMTADQNQRIKLIVEQRDGTLSTRIDTQQIFLPAWCVGKLVPGIGGCGEASFSGQVAVVSSDQDFRGKLQGQLTDVDLQRWSAATGTHRLQCLSQVELEEFTWSGATVEIVRGRIEAVNSAASYSLFQALEDPRIFHCGVGPGWEKLHPTNRNELIPFDRLAVGFHLSSAGIALQGLCADEALVVARSGPLLFSPPRGTLLPVASLVQLFHHPEKGWLPDTRGANEMARGLPLPGGKKSETETLQK